MNTFSIEGEVKKKLINTEVIELKDKIENNTLFISKSNSEKRKILNSRSGLTTSILNLINQTEMKELRMDELWNSYSNHSHSEYISDRQYNSYKKEGVSEDIKISILYECILLTLLCIKNVKDEFIVSNETFNNLSKQEKSKFNIWCQIMEGNQNLWKSKMSNT